MHYLVRIVAVALPVVLAVCGAMVQAGMAGDGVAGQTYYVAASGDDANPGTEAKPFKTMLQAVGLLKPGDTVLLRAGRYPAFKVQDLKGTEGAPITFKAYPGEKPVIDRHLGGNDGHFAVQLAGRCCYLVFDGLEITDSNPLIDALRKLDVHKPEDLAEFKTRLPELGECEGLWVISAKPQEPHHHLIFRNLTVHHLEALGCYCKGEDIQFLNNHMYDLGYPRSGYAWYASGTRLLFRGNRVHDCSYGLHLYTGSGAVNDTVVEDNIFYNNGRSFYHMSSRTVHAGGSGVLLWARGSGNVIRNNVLYNNYSGISVDSKDALVANNMVYASQRIGIEILPDKNVTVRNNIVYKSGTADLRLEKGNAEDHNLIGVDPLFVNPDAADFHLRAGSPAIDAGVAVAGVDVDFDGLKRPQGKAWDIGAFEFVSVGERQ